jgi:hypothetical protein
MRHRKCDTTKHRRRMKKQRENRAIRQQKEELVKAYVRGPEKVRAPDSSLLGPKPPAVICPLCNLPITVDDAVNKNMDTIMYNKQPVQVHKTCPTEVKK